jgi:hypothetical protein
VEAGRGVLRPKTSYVLDFYPTSPHSTPLISTLPSGLHVAGQEGSHLGHSLLGHILAGAKEYQYKAISTSCLMTVTHNTLHLSEQENEIMRRKSTSADSYNNHQF